MTVRTRLAIALTIYVWSSISWLGILSSVALLATHAMMRLEGYDYNIFWILALVMPALYTATAAVIGFVGAWLIHRNPYPGHTADGWCETQIPIYIDTALSIGLIGFVWRRLHA